MAKLIVKRLSKWKDLARSYRVYVDGQKIGELNDGEIKEFDISPGQHIIKAKYDFFSSKPVSIEVRIDDETIQMQVSNNQQIWDMIPFGLIFFILIGNVIKLLSLDDGFMFFVVFVVIFVFSMWLVYKITPYLKLEQVDDFS